MVLDRSAVLLLGVCAGGVIGFNFIAPPGSAEVKVISPSCSQSLAARDDIRLEVTAAKQCGSAPQRQLLQTLRKNAPVRIAVFGDSFGDGVWWGIQQQLPRKSYEVLKYSRPAIGFTRYKRLNLETLAAEQLGDQPVDIAVVSFGANDAQGIIADDGKHAPLMGERWQAQIGERIDRFVALLRKHHAMVYWVGLPPMREPGLEGDVSAINAFYAARMAKLGVPFIDTRPLASDAKGQYSAYLPDPKTGARTLVREGDGIRMSMTGYLWITRGLSDRIESYVEAMRALEPTADGK